MMIISNSILLIAGPTASGKSALALEAAKLTGGEIINADATQLYQDLRLLSARPSEAEERAAPHHLFGVLDGAVACSAAQWAVRATDVINVLWAHGKLPIVVGGTGLYLRTLLEGIAEVPAIPDIIRSSVRALEAEALTAALLKADPEAAARLHPSDRQRRSRALEVALGTGKTLAFWQRDTRGGLMQRDDLGTVLKLTLLPPREVVYARCDARLDAMVAQGVLAEVQALLARRLEPDLPVMKAVGMPEFEGYLRGMYTLDAALTDAKLATRHYAKRQYTWLRNQFEDWVALESNDLDVINQKLATLLRENGLTVK
jgi:tRNA dimethylallyltransferase